ncbi:MAG: hypothetical protein LUQ07_05990 [Methanospirillum sp.]|nr:hypothetical protein [Methanospirillum sp.]
MTAGTRSLVVVDIIFALIAIIVGNLALASLVRYTVTSLTLGSMASWSWTWLISLVILFLITILAFKKIDHPIIRMLVIICLFIPQILALLLQQTIPFPDVGFLQP